MTTLLESANATLIDGNFWHGNVFTTDGWVPSRGGTLTVKEPASGDVIAEVGLANAEDIDAASAAAAAAQPGWASTPGPDRAAVIRRVATLLEENREEVIDWIIRDGGAIRGKAETEIKLTLDQLWEAASLPTQPWGHLLPSGSAGRSGYARRVPIGVVGVIPPWNWPLLLAMRAVAPAIALGNAVVLKPDVQTAVSGGVVLARLFELAGLPQGVLHVMAGDAEPGGAITENPHIQLVSFTGSTAVGRIVGATAGRNLKRVALELGGNNAFVVLGDADLDAASSAGAWGSFIHQGQICMTAGRHIVVESAVDEYLQKLTARANKLTVGNPFREDVALGPLINQQQLDHVVDIVKDTVSAGAEIRTGGTSNALYYQPTVLADVTTDMRAFREEIFGPVAPVTIVKDDAEAIAAANDTIYGLSAAVQSRSVAHAQEVANHIKAGMVHVNDNSVNDEAWAPFGGMGSSGNFSRFGSQSHWDEFTIWQWFTVSNVAPQFAF